MSGNLAGSDPKAAVIWMPSDGSRVLVGYSYIEAEVAARAVSEVSWPGSAPDWAFTPPRLWFEEADASGHVPWPAPENLCEIAPCTDDHNGDGDIDEYDYWGSYNRVAGAYYLGVGGLAGLVVVGREQLSLLEETDVTILTSTDGGTSFTRSKRISLPTQVTSVSGRVDPDSVSASVMVRKEHGTTEQLDTPATLFVIWRSFTDNQWWATKVEFDFSGDFIQPDPPRKVTVIPETSFGLASIAAFETGSGEQAVYVGWSERFRHGRPAGGLQPDPLVCPSNDTLEIDWFYSYSVDFDSPSPTWQCTEQTTLGQWPPPYQDWGVTCTGNDQRNLMAEDDAWRWCLGSSFGTGTNAHHVNSDRPSLGFAFGPNVSNKNFYAINKSVGGSGPMRIHVYQDQLDSPPIWHPVFTSSDVPRLDHYGQDLTVHQGGWDWTGMTGPDVDASVAIAWREVADVGSTIVEGVTSREWGDINTFSPQASLVGTNWNSGVFEGNPVSLSHRQLCTSEAFGPCPGFSGAEPPFVGAWSMAPSNDLRIDTRVFTH